MIYKYRNINELTDTDYRNIYRNLKSAERNKINKILNLKHKKLCLAGYDLLAEILENEFSIAFKKLIISYNENGKPYFLNGNIYFNISHSEDYVVCVVSDKPIGIDIEKIKARNHKLVMNHYFSDLEKRYIDSSVDTLKTYWTIWTLKEAILKFYGDSILNIKNINLSIKKNKIVFTTKQYNLTVDYLKNDYVVSICSKD